MTALLELPGAELRELAGLADLRDQRRANNMVALYRGPSSVASHQAPHRCRRSQEKSSQALCVRWPYTASAPQGSCAQPKVTQQVDCRPKLSTALSSPCSPVRERGEL